MTAILASFLPVSGELGREAAFALRDALLPVAYLLALAGFFWQVSRQGDNWQAHFETIILTVVLVLALSNWAVITDALGSVSRSITQIARDRMEANQQVRFLTILATASIKAPGSSMFGGFDPWALLDALAYQGVQIVQRIATFAQLFLSWIQQFALNGLFAISPLLLGFITLPWTRQIATNFIFTTIGVALWDIGFALVDVIIYQIQDALLDFLRSGGVLIPASSELANGGMITVAAGLWPNFFAGYTAIVLFSILLYFLAPVFVGIMMRGANPNAGAVAILRQVAQAGRNAMAMANSAMSTARAAESFGAQIQAAQSTTQAGTAHAAAMGAIQQAVASGQGIQLPLPFSPGGSGGGSVPPPPGLIQIPSAAAGDCISSGDLSAVQVDAGSFQVVDSSGRTTTHPGNITDPQVREAAFTTHQVTHPPTPTPVHS